MIYCHANNFIFGPKRLNKEYCHSKEQSYGQKTSNLAFFSINKRHMACKKILVSTDILVEILVLSPVLLGITFIFAINLIYQL